jgi:hypothetical protein
MRAAWQANIAAPTPNAIAAADEAHAGTDQRAGEPRHRLGARLGGVEVGHDDRRDHGVDRERKCQGVGDR